MEYVNLFLQAVFIENIALAFFLGMCSFLAVSKKVDTAMGLGLAGVFVLTVTTPLNALIQNYILKEGALTWAMGEEAAANYDLSFLGFITFIATIAATVQVLSLIHI